MSILTTLQLIPLVGALLVALTPKKNSLLTKQVAFATSLVVAAVSIYMVTIFDSANKAMQFVEVRSWIPTFGINYAVGADGIAVVLILMTAVLVPIVILAGWNESEAGRWSVKTFFILMLVLETMMIGVFAATDVFLFYVIFEAMLLPCYFLIGGYGRGERAAAALKFLLYSLFGGLLMLAAVIGTYIIATNQIGGTYFFAFQIISWCILYMKLSVLPLLTI